MNANLKKDLGDDLTVFVITTGEPSTSECLRRLDAQDCDFNLEVVKNVTPMDRAFQAMLNYCETPFFIQVDADILLRPWAIQKLYNELAGREPEVAFVCGWLWDDDVQRAIVGVKCYRHDVCVKFPYESSVSCEATQFQAMQRAGYRYELIGNGERMNPQQCLGTHYASQNPELAFRRWQRLMQKYRRFPHMGWLAPYPRRLLEKVAAPGATELDQWRAYGVIAGLTGPLPANSEIDASLPDLDFRRLAVHMTDGPTEVTLYVTERCNHACVFDGVPCKRQVDDSLKTADEMSLDMVRTALGRYSTIRGVCIAGFGEPLLHSRIDEVVELARARFGPAGTVGIITNGAFLGGFVARAPKVAAMLTYISVSLNAATAEKHEAITRAKTWELVMDGIRAAVAAKLPVGLSFVVTRQTVSEIPAWLALAASLGVKFVTLHNILPHGGEDEHFLSRVLTKGCPEAEALREARFLPGAELVTHWPQLIEPGKAPGKCESAAKSLGVDAKGRLTPCRRIDAPHELYGNIKDEDPWNGPEVVNLRFEILGDRRRCDMCEHCFGNWRE